MLGFCCSGVVLNAQVQYTPPDFPTCPDGYDLIDNFEGELFANLLAGYNGVLSITEAFTLTCDADLDLVVLGFTKEGHPEKGCDPVPEVGDPDGCTQTQDLEEYDVDVDGGTIGGYDDNQGAGGVENAWFENEEWGTTATAGGHNMTYTHRYASQDVGVQSVDYKVSLCAKCITTTSTTTTVPVTTTITTSVPITTTVPVTTTIPTTTTTVPSKEIPTLSEWGMIIFMMIIIGISVVVLSRRRIV